VLKHASNILIHASNVDENKPRMRENPGYKYIEQTKGTNEIIDEVAGENND